MNRDAAIDFDRHRDFAAYWASDRVGAAYWLTQVADAASVECAALEPVRALFPGKPSAEEEAGLAAALEPMKVEVLPMGVVASTPLGELDEAQLQSVGWNVPKVLWPVVLVGQARVEPADERMRGATRSIQVLSVRQSMQRMITFETGSVKRVVVSPFNPLESIGADLSSFEGAYQIAVRAWPDMEGRLFVQEAAPVMKHTGQTPVDFASGRLYVATETGSPVQLRVNPSQIIAIEDQAFQEELRPFVGTGVMLYGKRHYDRNTGQVSLTALQRDLWVLCRLTDPADEPNNIPQAPLPSVQGETCICIGATPPWNWSGPNIRTHLLAPLHAASIIRTTERRFVFGSPLPALPKGITSPIPDVNRVFKVSAITDRETDGEAHLATRLGPVGRIVKDLTAIAHLTSAVDLV